MSARASKPCKDRPELEAMIEKLRNAAPGEVVGPFASSEEAQAAVEKAKGGEPRVGLVEEVARAIEASAELDAWDDMPPPVQRWYGRQARSAIRVVLDRMQEELRRRDVEASHTMTGGLNWLMAREAFREARKALEAST